MAFGVAQICVHIRECFLNLSEATVKCAALYLRVSTKEQTTGESSGWSLSGLLRPRDGKYLHAYEDEGISGANGRDKRPSYDRMLKDAVSARFRGADGVGRVTDSEGVSTHLVQALDELHSNRVDLYLHQQAIDTTTPSGKAMFQMTAVFAEFERAMITERVKAGLARAALAGTKLGRPALQINPAAVIKDRNEGMSFRAISAKHRISIGTVHGIVSENI